MQKDEARQRLRVLRKEDGAREKKPPRTAKKVLYISLLIVAVAGALALVVFRDQLNIDALRRMVTYFNVDAGQNGKFSYDENDADCFAALGGGLLVASPAKIVYFNEEGTETATFDSGMDKPAISCAGSRAVVYDLGGYTLKVIDKSSVKHELTTDYPIISASINDDGWVTLTSGAVGYKAVVTVYNSKWEEVYKWNSSSSYIVDACLSPDCSTMAAVSLGTGDDQFDSTISFYKLNQEQAAASYTLAGSLILKIGYVGGSRVCAVADDSLLFVNEDGGNADRYEYPYKYLKCFSIDGDGFAALAISKYKAGGRGELITVGTDGQVIASLEVNEDVSDISAAGRYIGALIGGRLDIYTKNLQLYSQLTDTEGANNVIMREDGTAMLAGAISAKLYIP